MNNKSNGVQESDPHGKDPHEKGAKLDSGKIRPELVLGQFPRALIEVVKVGTYGAKKYTDNGWLEVPDGERRYDDAGMRHWLYEHTGQQCDQDTGLTHLAHQVWNCLARLELQLRRQELKARDVSDDLVEKVNKEFIPPFTGQGPQQMGGGFPIDAHGNRYNPGDGRPRNHIYPSPPPSYKGPWFLVRDAQGAEHVVTTDSPIYATLTGKGPNYDK